MAILSLSAAATKAIAADDGCSPVARCGDPAANVIVAAPGGKAVLNAAVAPANETDVPPGWTTCACATEGVAAVKVNEALPGGIDVFSVSAAPTSTIDAAAGGRLDFSLVEVPENAKDVAAGFNPSPSMGV